MKKFAPLSCLFALFLLVGCQNSGQLPLDLEQARASLSLADGAAISSDLYDEFNPTLVHGDDLHLYLIFASDRPCSISCSNYNIFISKSIEPYFGEPEIPAFEDPLPLSQNSSAFNFATEPNFVAKAFSGELRIYVVESSQIRWGDALNFVSTSYNVGASLNAITNTGQQNAKILGIDEFGSIFSQNGSQQIFSFDPEGAGGIEIFNDNLVDALSVAVLRFGLTSYEDAAVTVLGSGEIVATAQDGLLGSFDSFNQSLEAAELRASSLRFFYGPGFETDLITFSAGSAQGTEDIYLVTSHSPLSLWASSFE